MTGTDNLEQRIKRLEDLISLRVTNYQSQIPKQKRELIGIRFASQNIVEEIESKMFPRTIGNSYRDTQCIMADDWLSLKERLLKISEGKG